MGSRFGGAYWSVVRPNNSSRRPTFSGNREAVVHEDSSCLFPRSIFGLCGSGRQAGSNRTESVGRCGLCFVLSFRVFCDRYSLVAAGEKRLPVCFWSLLLFFSFDSVFLVRLCCLAFLDRSGSLPRRFESRR